jgi:hypothetical protein
MPLLSVRFYLTLFNTNDVTFNTSPSSLVQTTTGMKKIMTFAAGVLFSTLAFADGSTGVTGSKVAVVNSGSDLIQVFYKAAKSTTVTVSILNENEEKVFTEKMKGENFMRPYNFKGLPSGNYTIRVSDADGTHSEKIEYGISSQENKATVLRLNSTNDRYLVSGFTPLAESISVKIYDADGKVIFQDDLKADGKFAKVYNLAAVKGSFTIQVSDKDGSLKDFESTK